MRNWSITAPRSQDVAVLLLPRFSNHCLANAVEPLRAANEFLMREFYRWTFVTLDGDAVESSSGLPVMPNCKLRDHPGGAFLFVLSSYDVRSFATPAMSKALIAARTRFQCVVGMDTGAWLMAKAGLLNGAKATIHWDELAAFSETFSNVDVMTDRFVINGNAITCGGAMTAFDLVLDLIRRTHGEALGLEVSAFFLHESARPPQDRVIGHRASPLVERSLALMSSTIESPLSIGEIAQRVGTTQRALNRAFRAEIGAPPMTAYRRLRLGAARRYAQNSTFTITEIALRCGYQNAAAMTRAFCEQFGRPPSAFRRGS